MSFLTCKMSCWILRSTGVNLAQRDIPFPSFPSTTWSCSIFAHRMIWFKSTSHLSYQQALVLRRSNFMKAKCKTRGTGGHYTHMSGLTWTVAGSVTSAQIWSRLSAPHCTRTRPGQCVSAEPRLPPGSDPKSVFPEESCEESANHLPAATYLTISE